MSVRSTAATAIAAMALAGMVACGSSTTTSGSNANNAAATSGSSNNNLASAPDACTLLTQSDVAQITGDTGVAKSYGSGDAQSSSCRYTDSNGGGNGYLTISRVPAGGLPQGALGNDIGGSATQFSGLGDQALKLTSTTSAAYAFVKGNFYAFISFHTSTPDTGLDSKALSVAQTVANHF